MSGLRVVYIHGIHSHPDEASYRAEWDAALRRLAYVPEIETKMVYWADVRNGVTAAMVDAAKARAKARGGLHQRMPPKGNTPLGYAISFVLHTIDPVIRRITKGLLSDVYLYFYGRTGAENIRDVILDRMDAIMREFQPDIIIAHSWGSVIVYDYLMNRGYDGEIEALITAGSPLGQDYVQAHVGAHSYPDGVRRWLNIFDAMDPAAWPDRRLANDLPGPRGERLIRDMEVPSLHDEDGHRDAHSWYGYLMTEPLQNEIFRVAASRNLWPPAKLPATASDLGRVG